ncbi:MAG: hypothetical protein HY736_21370 [Verrucomicrobia bacterium]|nr:hypothetical protein [Verrucomicrobiota bacterium]
MSGGSGIPGSHRVPDLLAVAARWLLAAVFLYLGLGKALHPVEFLKLVRQYGVFEDPLLLNLVAAVLPWFEVICGLLLLAGVTVRGAVWLLVAMLIPFTALILLRALAIRELGALPFCAIKFDCGCGGGEVFICPKLFENAGLTILSVWLAFYPRQRLCLRPAIVASAVR